MKIAAALLLATLSVASAQTGEDTHAVALSMVSDRKAVFATVESIDIVSARARIGGTIGELRVDEGDEVAAGDVLAVVVDDRLAPQTGAANAQVAALRAQLAQAQTELGRAQDLFDRGIYPQARLDQAQTAVDVVEGQLDAARQERAVIVQQAREGEVLAPATGRVLDVPVTAGSVVLPGEAIATIASELYLLRLRLPERHARSIEVGDPVEIAGSVLGEGLARTGEIRQVYPRIEDGRVVADATVDGLGDYFVGERVRVLIEVDQRPAYLIPAGYVSQRYGVDYVRVRMADGRETDIVVQVGPARGDRIEILGGLAEGDILVRP